MSPRAWRWNSDTPSSCSSADTCRDTADCDRPSCSPAWVKLPASAAAWKTLSLSQSMVICALGKASLRGHGRLRLALRGEEAFGFERCHAALTGGGYRLAVDVIGNVARGEHAGHRGRGRERRGLDVTRGLHIDLPYEQFGCGSVADGDEYAVGPMLAKRAGFDVAQDGSIHLEWVLLAHHLLQHRVPDHRNLGILEQPILQDLLRAETVAPVHNRHAGSEIGEEQRLLDRGIAAADHQHLLAAIEEAVAGGAGGNAVTPEFLLGRQLQPTRLGAGRDDEAVCEVMVAGLALEPERPMGEIDLADMIADELGADVLGLLLHLLHQPRPLDDVREARIVLDVGGDRELATGLDALDQDRLQHGAGGIDRGRIARRPGPDDEELGALDLSHREQTPSGALRQSACSKAGSRCCTAIKLAEGVDLSAVRAPVR